MVRLSVEVFGDKQLERSLHRFADRADDLRTPFREIQDMFRGVASKQFTSQGRYGSGGWRPIAPATVAAKMKAGLDPRILHATHRLRRSLTTRRHPDHISTIRRDTMEFGSSVPYGVHHQHGAPRANLPKRPPFELRKNDRRSAVKILQRHLVEGGL